MRSLSCASISKHSGPLMSSRLMPPKVGSSAATVSTTRSMVSASISMSNTSMPANFLNRTALPSITGFDAERSDIAEAEHGGAVGDDGDEIGARGQRGRFRRIFGDRRAGGRNARRIGQRKVALVGERLGRLNLELSRPRQPVIGERRGLEIFGMRRHAFPRRAPNPDASAAIPYLRQIEPDVKHAQARSRKL